jgi:hypothetical protein
MSYVYLERKDLGASLSSWITTSMNALNAAVAEGVTGCIRWPEHRSPRAYHDEDAFDRCPNMFEWYFDQPWCQAERPAAAPIWVYEDAHEMISRYPIANFSAFFRQYLLFNAEVVARLEALLARYGLRPEQALAVSWRGTDNVIDGRPRIPIDSFFPVIDGILEAEPDLTIVAKPEERGAAEALLRRYPKAIVPSEFFVAEAGETQMQDWVNPASGYERGMEVALLILLFSRCRYLLKNNANLSDIATRLSVGEVISWSTATNWARWRQSSAR